MKRFVCLAIALSSTVFAVAQAPPEPAFDVASVKRNTSGGPMRMANQPGNFIAFNMPVRQLVRMAYQLQDVQIAGLPDWANTVQFDVQGRFEPPAAPPPPGQPPRMLMMVRTLLRDRFGMVSHTETRELPIYALRVARNDGRLGPQIRRAAVDCAALNPARGRGPVDARGGPPLQGRSGGPPPPGPPLSLGERPVCGDRMGFGQLLAGGMPISRFVSQLSQLTGRVVIDRTGLSGNYDIDLEWTPTADQLPPGPPPPGVALPQIDPNGPSLFTALQEQLGLKLDTERGPVDVLVVERLQPPIEN